MHTKITHKFVTTVYYAPKAAGAGAPGGAEAAAAAAMAAGAGPFAPFAYAQQPMDV